MQRPDLYAYLNYRDFLADYYAFAKIEISGFTYEKFSRKAGVKSPNILKLIIDGKKNLTTTTALKFARAAELTLQETEYFEALVLENQSQDGDEAAYYKKRLRSLKELGAQRSLKVTNRSGVFDNPLVMPAIVLLSQEPTLTASQKLQQQLGLSDYEADRFIKSLLANGIMDEKESRYVFNFEQGIFHKKTADAILKNYLKTHLSISQRAFATQYDKGSKFFSHSMGVPADRYDELIEDIDRFISAMNKKYDQEPAERVLQLNLQCFWLENSLTKLR